MFFGPKHVGDEAWQWVYETTDPWKNTVLTKSQTIALTSNAGQPPLCYPGYIADQKTSNAQYCFTGGCIPGYSQCHEVACDANNVSENPKRALRGNGTE